MAQLSAATLEEQADLLTNPSLSRAMIKVIKDRGASELFAQLPFKSFQGQTYDFTQEEKIADGNSAQNPYDTTIPSGGGKNKRQSVPVTMFIRQAITPKIDVLGKSDFYNQRRDDMEKEAKRLARDFFEQFLNGLVDESSSTDAYNLRGLEYWFKQYASTFPEQTFYATSDGTISGNAENLSYTHFDELLSRHKGNEFDVIYMNRETEIAFRSLLNNMGGNIAQMLMIDTFGQQMLTYDGTPIVCNDSVGMDKRFSDAEVSGTTVTFNDSGFLGVSDLSVGQTIYVSDNDETATVASVTNAHELEIETASDLTDGSGLSGRVEQENVMYAVRFDSVDGVCAVYHDNRGVPANPGEYYGPISGFDAEDQGLLEDSPRYQTRMDFYGQLVAHDPRSIARAVGFSL